MRQVTTTLGPTHRQHHHADREMQEVQAGQGEVEHEEIIAQQGDTLDDNFVIWIESSGCYWHMVDLLWIVLFSLLYLLHAT